MRKTWLLVSIMGTALAGRASAAPSLFGPTGLLVIPTADTLAPVSWNTHARIVDTGGDAMMIFGGNYGITRQLEVGLSGVDFKPLGMKALLNAKYALLMESRVTPGVALGGLDIASQMGSSPGVYLVASKSLSSLLGGPLTKYNIRGHLGYGANNVFNDDLFGGLDMQVTPKVQAMVEWLHGGTYFGGRFGVGLGLQAELGSYDGHIGGGISYAAGLR
jgi:hypothetical protein